LPPGAEHNGTLSVQGCVPTLEHGNEKQRGAAALLRRPFVA